MMPYVPVLLIAVIVLSGFSSPLYAQGLNPAYLSQMPAPARVLAEIRGKDAEDTLERQMGAFQTLVDIIDDMAYGIGHRYVAVTDNTRATQPITLSTGIVNLQAQYGVAAAGNQTRRHGM